MESVPRLRVAAVAFLASCMAAGSAGAHDFPLAAQAAQAVAPAANAPGMVLFRNVRIFDGKSGRVSGPGDVLVRGNRIDRIGVGLAPEPAARAHYENEAGKVYKKYKNYPMYLYCR